MKSISGWRFCRILEAYGWQLQRVHGSHHIYAKNDLKKGTLHHLLKDAGLIKDDL